MTQTRRHPLRVSFGINKTIIFYAPNTYMDAGYVFINTRCWRRKQKTAVAIFFSHNLVTTMLLKFKPLAGTYIVMVNSRCARTQQTIESTKAHFRTY